MRSGPVAQQDKRSLPGHGALSISQQRLWVLEHLHPRNPAHDVSCGLQLTGPLDTRKFGRARREVVQGYEILRTEFHAVEGVPHPVEVTSFSPELSAGDWEGVPPEECAASLSQLFGKKPPRTDWRQAYWPGWPYSKPVPSSGGSVQAAETPVLLHLIRRWGGAPELRAELRSRRLIFITRRFCASRKSASSGKSRQSAWRVSLRIPKQETSTEEQQVSLITASVQHRQQGS